MSREIKDLQEEKNDLAAGWIEADKTIAKLEAENMCLRNRLRMEMSWHRARGNFGRVAAIKEVLEAKD